MRKRVEKKEDREKSVICNKYVLFSVFFSLFSFFSFHLQAQDSIPVATDLSEEKELKFQQFFFKALADKSITNYQKAIENLENCNQLLPNNTAVFFEFSKNYLLMNNTMLAKEYINLALNQDPEDIWMLSHLVDIYKKDNNYSDAITIQKKIIRLNSNKKADLVYLYLSNREFDKTIALLQEIEQEKGLNRRLSYIKNSLKKRNLNADVVQEAQVDPSLTNLKEQFENEKSFEILKKIFIILENDSNNLALETISAEGISLFPAQPLVYLTHGKSLNNQKKFSEALATLKNGIDFVIEDKMEAEFYVQMCIASEGKGNLQDAKKYSNLAKKLKL